MKKLIFSVVMVMAVMIFVVSGAHAAVKVTESKDVKIVIDSQKRNTTNAPIMVNGRTMLPLREIATQLGVSNDEEHIKWNSATKTVYLSKDNTVINLEINKKIAKVNGQDVELDVEPLIYANRTYIPVRFVSQSFGKKVAWDASTKSVLICNEEEYNKVKDILDKSIKAMESAKKYKLDFEMDMSATGEDNQKASIVKYGVKAQFDTEKMKAKLDMDISMFFILNIKSQSYMADNIVYEKNSFTNKWTKESKTPEEFIDEFKKNNDISSFGDTSIVSAGLRVAESKNADEIVLTGDVILEKLTQGPGEGLGESGGEFKADNNYKLNITIDKNTNYIKKVDMTFSGKLDDGGDSASNMFGVSAYDALFNCSIYDIDGSFEVVQPDDLDITKVEEKSSTDTGLGNFDFGDAI